MYFRCLTIIPSYVLPLYFHIFGFVQSQVYRDKAEALEETISQLKNELEDVKGMSLFPLFPHCLT